MTFPSFRKRRSAGSDSNGLKEEGRAGNGNPVDVKRLTRTRRNTIFFVCFCYLVAWIFLIVVETGNTKGVTDKNSGDIYFFKLDLSDILPQALPSSSFLLNSIARTLGLHDFYQVGLWNFCEGYDDEGITFCSKPENMYWFNPVQIIRSELFSGASIALPADVNEILGYIKLASNIMFGFFLAGLILDFVLMFLTPIVMWSRWWSLPVTILAFIAAIMVVVAAGVGTAMSLIFRYALTSQSDLNIKVVMGIKMFVFMWIAAAFTLLAFLLHAGMGCCCTSKRDLKTGRKKGKNLVQASEASAAEQKEKKRGFHMPKLGGNKSASSG